jgi:hypothetical protein
MKSLSTLLKAGYALKHKQVEQGFCEYLYVYIYIYIYMCAGMKMGFIYLLNLIGKAKFLVSNVKKRLKHQYDG